MKWKAHSNKTKQQSELLIVDKQSYEIEKMIMYL